MHTHRNKKYLIAMVEHSDYIAILGSLLIGFTIAWTLRQPGFHKQPFVLEHSAAPELTRELPDPEERVIDGAEQANPQYGEFLPLEEKQSTAVWDIHRPTPELFTKVTPLDDGYLVAFTVSNFSLGKEGFLMLYQDDQPLARVYASPYFISQETITASSDLTFVLTYTDGTSVVINDSIVQEPIRFE